MHEEHSREQYFFDPRTIEELTGALADFENPCCLCAPTVGRALAETGASVRILDIDERFSDCAGFRRFDLYRPDWIGEAYDLILCDPPFFNVSLSQLFTAVRMLSRYLFDQPLAITYLERREPAILGTFAPFGLQPTGYRPGYQTVQPCEKNVIQLYANIDWPLSTG